MASDSSTKTGQGENVHASSIIVFSVLHRGATGLIAYDVARSIIICNTPNQFIKLLPKDRPKKLTHLLLGPTKGRESKVLSV